MPYLMSNSTSSTNGVLYYTLPQTTTSSVNWQNWWFKRNLEFVSRSGVRKKITISFSMRKEYLTGVLIGSARAHIDGTDIHSDELTFQYGDNYMSPHADEEIASKLGQQCIDIFNIMEEMEVETKRR